MNVAVGVEVYQVPVGVGVIVGVKVTVFVGVRVIVEVGDTVGTNAVGVAVGFEEDPGGIGDEGVFLQAWETKRSPKRKT